MNDWRDDLHNAAEMAVEDGISMEEFVGAALELWDEFHDYSELRKNMVLSRNAKAGDITDMRLDGRMCQWCCAILDGVGYPHLCQDCAKIGVERILETQRKLKECKD